MLTSFPLSKLACKWYKNIIFFSNFLFFPNFFNKKFWYFNVMKFKNPDLIPELLKHHFTELVGMYIALVSLLF